MTADKVILYGYRWSSCSWRVRAALVRKRIPYEERAVDIVKARDQHTDKYKAINPAQKVPALVIEGEIKHRSINEWEENLILLARFRKIAEKNIRYDGVTLVESMAIIQYLEDTRPDPKLVPESALAKARMREICETVVSGIQPLQNIGLKSRFDNDEQYIKFSRHFCERGLETLEDLVKKSKGSYCVGDQLSLADLCVVPQLFNITNRFQMKIDKYTTLSKLFEKLLAEPVFKETCPDTLKK